MEPGGSQFQGIFICSINQAFVILSPDKLTASVNTANVSCNGAGDGAIDLSLSDGVYKRRAFSSILTANLGVTVNDESNFYLSDFNA